MQTGADAELGGTLAATEERSTEEPISAASRRRLVEELFLCLRTGEPALERLLAPDAVLKSGGGGGGGGGATRQLRRPSRDQILSELDAATPSELDYDPLSLRALDATGGRSFAVSVSGTQTRPGTSTDKELSITVADGPGPLKVQTLQISSSGGREP